MRKYGEGKTTRIMMATVPHVTDWAWRTKYQVDGFLFNWVYTSPKILGGDKIEKNEMGWVCGAYG